jgi:AraC-like DNA-binding protein
MSGPSNHIKLIDKFPDFKAPGFNAEIYDRQFKEKNIIIKATSSNVSYPEHWGPLSVKCCLGGKENYRIGKRFYSVHDNNFLVLNHGQYYSSYIYSDTDVESFTLNFTEEIQKRVITSVSSGNLSNLDDPFNQDAREIVFTEKLHTKDDFILPLLTRLKELSNDFYNEHQRIEELLYLILERLILIQRNLRDEIVNVDALKPATKTELYKRLHYVKDFLDSCYQNDVTLDDMAGVANLNSTYLLRKFKKFFSITPRQYLIKKRMETAAVLLKTTDHSITEICSEVGYADLTSFGKLFKYFYHCSPEKYKRQHRVTYFN